MMSKIFNLLEGEHLLHFFTDSLRNCGEEVSLWEYEEVFGRNNIRKTNRERNLLTIEFFFENKPYRSVYSISPFTGSNDYLHIKTLDKI